MVQQDVSLISACHDVSAINQHRADCSYLRVLLVLESLFELKINRVFVVHWLQDDQGAGSLIVSSQDPQAMELYREQQSFIHFYCLIRINLRVILSVDVEIFFISLDTSKLFSVSSNVPSCDAFASVACLNFP